MAGKAPKMLARRLVSSSRPPNPHSSIRSTRLFCASSRSDAVRSPSLSSINPNNAEEFTRRQKEFREHLAASHQHAHSQSYPYPAPGSSLSASASDGASGESPVERPLGSLSPHNTEEAFEASKTPTAENGKKKGGPLRSIIYGTEAGRQMDHDIERSFSQQLSRGKYVHGIFIHSVKPDKVDEYVDLVGNFYPKIANDPANKVNLVGSWRTEVGDCDTFVHIWEYQRYTGYHASLNEIWSKPEVVESDAKMRKMINWRKSSLMQEFSFWPTTPPRKLGGLFELRSYTLHPGNLLEWENHWRKGLEARREVMEGVGAWFVQIGDLNTVHFLWQFADLEQRRTAREKSWSVEGWSDTVHKTVPLIQSMKSRIMIPMPWSPVG